jgi:hypothetical protein
LSAKDGGDRPLRTVADEFRDSDSRLNQLTHEIAIVGAGAAGLATAIFARRLNPSHSIVLIDSAAKPGAKILVSGGSRCNVTNVAVSERDFNGGNPAVIRRILKAFPQTKSSTGFARLALRSTKRRTASSSLTPIVTRRAQRPSRRMQSFGVDL